MQINQGIALLILYFLLSYNEVQGEIKLSEEEDQELERQLKLLNKPAIKTIKTKYGDIYDCVDFYKQPAFDHPLLKSHNFHPKMKATTLLKQNSRSSMSNESSMIWLNGRGCPFGSVPIKRITKDDLIRHRRLPPPEDVAFHTQFAKTSNDNLSEHSRGVLSAQGSLAAVASTLNDWNNKFAGGGMKATLWNPHVEGQQSSACRLKVQKGIDAIQVGWRVDPTLYGDAKTRFFMHFQAGNTRCFNTLCAGFVVVNQKFPIGGPFIKVSKRGDIHSIMGYTMYIYRDIPDGHWWVLVGENHEQLGFWPRGIFTDLSSFATNVEWGGEAYSPPGIPEPPMGSGVMPARVFANDAAIQSLTVVDPNGIATDPKTNSQTDNPVFYNVLDIPDELGGHTVYYGGPGEVVHS